MDVIVVAMQSMMEVESRGAEGGPEKYFRKGSSPMEEGRLRKITSTSSAIDFPNGVGFTSACRVKLIWNRKTWNEWAVESIQYAVLGC